MSIPPPLWDALNDSIFSGVFIDTKFVVFSERVKATGRIKQPRILFAASTVVKSVPYLASCFIDDDKLSEDAEVLYVDDYDYDSDSDFEDSDLQTPISTGELLDPADLLSKQGAKSCASSDPPTVVHLVTPNVPTITSTPQITHTIVIQDVAFVTFHALLLYLYTHEITFAPHGSTFLGGSGVNATGPNNIQRPSAKSIYHLASKYNIPCLRKLALAEIHENLREYNLQDEVFGKLTAQYPELRDLFLQQLKRDIQSSYLPCLPTTVLQQKFKEYASGKLPHAQDTILMLYDLLSVDKPLGFGGKPLLSSQLPLLAPLSTTGRRVQDWVDLKDAIVESLCSGIFIDSKFYAPVSSIQPSDPPNLQPLYFCSSVNPAVVQKLNSVLVEIKPNHGLNTVNLTEGADDQERLTLKFGDWQSWRSIFLYIYTTEVSFTPLLNPLPSFPPQKAVCAPKPVYTLSDKVGLFTLRNLALCYIRSKMNNENIIEEFFSEFSSEHREIQEMEHQLLQQELKCTKTTLGIRQKILESSLGQYPHHATAIALVFEGLGFTENVPSSFPIATTARSNPGSYDPPKFAPFNEQDPSNSHLILTYQSISCMLQYRSLSFEELRVKHYHNMPTQITSEKPTSQQNSVTLDSSQGLTVASFGNVVQNNSVADPITHTYHGSPSNKHRRKRR